LRRAMIGKNIFRRVNYDFPSFPNSIWERPFPRNAVASILTHGILSAILSHA
jgi:hypothetical protein